MKFKQHCLFGLITSTLVVCSEQTVQAFSINLPSPDSLPCDPGIVFYCSFHSFSFPGPDGGTVSTELKPLSVLPLGGTNELLNLLNTSIWQENGWSFQKAAPREELQGSFDIKVYNAYATLRAVAVKVISKH